MGNKIKMLECKYCSHRSGLNTPICPSCGHDLALFGRVVTVDSPERNSIPKNSHRKSILPAILAAVLVLVLVAGGVFLLGRSDGDPPVPTTPQMAIETTAPTQPPVQTTIPEETTEPLMPREDRTLKNFSLGSSASQSQAFGSRYPKSQIQTITFVDFLPDDTADAWDVSENGKGNVLAWVEQNGELYDLYIGAEGGVVAPESCESMFGTRNAGGWMDDEPYKNLIQIRFNGNLDTANVTNMSKLFAVCENLTELDLDTLNTSSVTDMSFLFHNCVSLTALNLSSFDTSSVENMWGMFNSCGSLRELDLHGFDTANVENMRSMFQHCRSLTALDLSSFNTASVTDMQHMFYDCSGLTELDLRSFDMSNVTNQSDMFSLCNARIIW